MEIFYLSAFSESKYYGQKLNRHISLLPDDSWICITDLDTMFLTLDSGLIMEQAIQDFPGITLFTCATNRNKQRLDPDPNILNHLQIAEQRAQAKSYKTIRGIVAGYFWLFPKKLWIDHPFDNLPLVYGGNTFDVRWTRKLRCRKVVIEHLYIFHTYRLGRDAKSIEHLR